METRKVKDIVIKDRARVDLGDLSDLRESIRKRGLFNPIMITKDNVLIGGMRRYQCHVELQLEEIKVSIWEDLGPLEQKIFELEENLHLELSWDEQAKLRAEIHILEQQKRGAATRGHESDGWSLTDTANMLSVSPATISQDLLIANAIKEIPELSNLNSRRQALKVLNALEERAILTVLARKEAGRRMVAIETEQSNIPIFDMTRVPSENIPAYVPYTTIHGDSVEYLRDKVEDETIDLVIFDPPWGIDIDVIGSSRGIHGDPTSYSDDSYSEAWNFLRNIVPEIYRVMKNNTAMYIFFGIGQYHEFYEFLTKRPDPNGMIDPKTGRVKIVPFFYVRPMPLIWVKDGGGYTDHEVKFMPRYETAFYCLKGLRRLNFASSDVFEHPRPLTTKRIHTQQKALGLIQKMIQLSSVENELVLDPCAGSFVTCVAATLLGRRSIGIERDENNYMKGRMWLQGMIESAEIEEGGKILG